MWSLEIWERKFWKQKINKKLMCYFLAEKKNYKLKLLLKFKNVRILFNEEIKKYFPILKEGPILNRY